MFPMISEPWEFDEAKTLVEEQRAWLGDRKKRLPTHVRYGAMMEVPALAEVLDLLLPKIDFLSIGTNDLTQFLFAADRSNPRLAERYDWLSPAILRFLRRIVREADAARVPLAVCGEMGGRTLEAMALIGIGVRRLSVTPVAVGPLKAMMQSLDRAAAMEFLDDLLARPPANMRGALAQWADEQGVALA
jgi:phosphotransferase system enzyme I (PtsP)